jgi:hypothetical protein
VGWTCGAAARFSPWRCSCATTASRGAERATNNPVDVHLGPTNVFSLSIWVKGNPAIRHILSINCLRSNPNSTKQIQFSSMYIQLLKML